jgi:two-component system phosphate regulon sensor histidine kinase PhoR
MLWPILTALALLGLVALHLWWQSKFRRATQDARRETQRLREEHLQSSRQEQNQRAALFDSMVEGLLLLDEAGRVQLANRAFNGLFGIRTDIRHRTIIEALRLHELNELLEELGTKKQVIGCELKVSRASELCLQVNGSALFDSSGRRTGTILVFHDLTRLKHLERTRQEFVANVSHELRTPLSLIKGYVETLLEGAKDNPEIAGKFLQTIDRNAERLRLLIEDLLTISELESGRVILDLQPLRLRTLTEKVLADFKAPADAKQIALVDEVPDLQVSADGARLEQVICNLVDNSIKYGRNGGKVTIGAQVLENAKQVEVFISDDGPGIPADALERIFERFYRVDKARSREQGGTGLGLSIVKHIVQGHGGRAWAKSEPGQGATFCFTLPWSTEATAAVESAPPAEFKSKRVS